MKRENEFVSSKLGRFTSRLDGSKRRRRNARPTYEPGGNDYADWVIVAVHGLREYLDHPYRRLLDVLHEMSRMVEKLGLAVARIPDFYTMCVRKQQLKVLIWRIMLRLSAELDDLGDV